MSDIPLGFGVTAKSTADCRKMDPSGIVVFHQADVGMSFKMLRLSPNSVLHSGVADITGFDAVTCVLQGSI